MTQGTIKIISLSLKIIAGVLALCSVSIFALLASFWVESAGALRLTAFVAWAAVIAAIGCIYGAAYIDGANSRP